MGKNREARIRIASGTLMALLALLTVILLLVLPKFGGGSTVGVVLGIVVSALALAKAATFLRAGANATYWTRRTSPIVNGLLALFIVLALVSQLVNPRAEFAYFTAFAGLLLSNLFQVKAASKQKLRPVPPTLVVGMAIFTIAAVGATVWTVQAIPDSPDVMVNTLVLSTIFLWLCSFLAIIRLYTEHWAPRRAQRTP